MKNVQLILLATFICATTYCFTRLRSQVLVRLFVLVFTGAAAGIVIFPEVTQWAATKIGVGRGVDVVVYFMIVFLCYACLMLYSKLRAQEVQLVELARSIALANAKYPASWSDPELRLATELDPHLDSELVMGSLEVDAPDERALAFAQSSK